MLVFVVFHEKCKEHLKHTFRHSFIMLRNIMPVFTPGPTPKASNADTPEKSFTLFFEDQIIDETVTWTNVRSDAEAAKYQRRMATVQRTTTAEVRAMLGI